MRVRVQYLGPVRVIVNKREEDLDLPLKATVYDLLRELSNTYGQMFEREVFEDGRKNVIDGLIVTVNGTAAARLKGLETRLKLGDVVTLLPLFAGGG